MADDTGGTGPLPTGKGPDPEFQNVLFQLTAPERAIGLAGVLIVVVVTLIGDMLLADFSVSSSVWLIALACMGAMYFYYAGERNPWHDFYPWIIEIGGWAIGLVAIVHGIGSIFDSSTSAGATLFFQIVFYVAGAFALVGAYQLRTGD
jgi:hypothetical protein